MAGRYIISEYKKAGDGTPIISYRTDDYKDAFSYFIISAKRRIRSVVLYYTGTDAVLNFAIDGEPIYLVMAIEEARVEMELNALVHTGTRKIAEALAGRAIDAIVKALTGVAVPGLGGIFVDQLSRPYFDVKRDRARSARARGGLFAGASGAVYGFTVGGPIGSIIWGVASAAVAVVGAPSVVESFSQPIPTCTVCQGAGMGRLYKRCTHCNGYGYRD